ncbi:MAG: NAD(P)/FAD-dependent oxidoreductase, partial [Actinomycetota bacterium]|nr:NAD(P)/FAD-dependent oxidoreductase [Actinomycetota bacterium]
MSSPPKRFVIVGGAIAGVSAADTLRAEGFDGKIIVIGEEPQTAYSRPALSKTILREIDAASSITLPQLPSEVEVLTSTTVTSLSVEDRTVSMVKDGHVEQLSFDGLIIATGSRARSLARDGQTGEHRIRTLDDATALSANLIHARTVSIIGGGFLALELASSMQALGVAVTIIHSFPLHLRHLGDALSELMFSAARDCGVTFQPAPGGVELWGDPQVIGVRIDQARVLESDLVITAIGDIPNVAWLRGSPLEGGEALEVTPGGFVRPGIVAAGDVTARRHPRSGNVERSPHWHSAINQGRSA